MLKCLAEIKDGGNLYMFGLPETNMNRLQFKNEPIFFDFGYAGNPKLFGLILYFEEFREIDEIMANPDAVKQRCLPFVSDRHGVNGETLRVFPIAKRIMEELRATPYCYFQTQIEIAHPNDVQLFFSGRTEQEIEQRFREQGLITDQTKKTYKGVGGRN